ncbi:MAG: hypothetical protein ABR972_12460 [Acidimicrobiales bacterium]|jgi:hypothetical protein
MAKMVITHGAVGVDNWLKFKTERTEFVGMMGGTNVVDLVAQDGSNKVAVAATSTTWRRCWRPSPPHRLNWRTVCKGTE